MKTIDLLDPRIRAEISVHLEILNVLLNLLFENLEDVFSEAIMPNSKKITCIEALKSVIKEKMKKLETEFNLQEEE